MVCLATIFLTGCISHTLTPNTEKVTVIPNGSYGKILTSCKFLGQISNRDIHGDSTYFVSDENLKTDDIRFLKNEAIKLNANIVTFKKHEIVSEPQATIRRRPNTKIKHAIEANAYSCPIEIEERLDRWELKTDY